jgi:hypothetical protein
MGCSTCGILRAGGGGSPRHLDAFGGYQPGLTVGSTWMYDKTPVTVISVEPQLPDDDDVFVTIGLPAGGTRDTTGSRLSAGAAGPLAASARLKKKAATGRVNKKKRPTVAIAAACLVTPETYAALATMKTTGLEEAGLALLNKGWIEHDGSLLDIARSLLGTTVYGNEFADKVIRKKLVRIGNLAVTPPVKVLSEDRLPPVPVGGRIRFVAGLENEPLENETLIVFTTLNNMEAERKKEGTFPAQVRRAGNL